MEIRHAVSGIPIGNPSSGQVRPYHASDMMNRWHLRKNHGFRVFHSEKRSKVHDRIGTQGQLSGLAVLGVVSSKLGAELLFDVISTAYIRTSAIVTSNLRFENRTEVLGSERLTGATLDRLTHRCHIIECNGESYRLRDAKRRRSTRKRED